MERPPQDFTGLWVAPDASNSGARHEVELINGVANGLWRYVLGNGVCVREAGAKNGQWHGKMVIRDAEGTVLDSSEFNEGTGVYRIFASDGRLVDEIPMRCGKKHGAARCWRGGKLVVSNYIDGDIQAQSD